MHYLNIKYFKKNIVKIALISLSIHSSMILHITGIRESSMASKKRSRTLYPADILRNSFAIGLAMVSIAHADDGKLSSEPLDEGCNTSEQHAACNSDKAEEAKCGAGQCGTAKCGVGKCAGSSPD